MSTGTLRRAAAAGFALAIAAMALGPRAGAQLPQSVARTAVVLQIHDAIGPATSRYFVQTLQAAQQRGAALVIMELDTPGGLDTSMREMIQAILASPIPVAVFVAPSGSRAASAGTYLLYASHIAAMAPATNLGAATPVQMIGSGGPGATEPGPAAKEPGPAAPADAHERKAVNDAVAYIRSLAELRHRNADWAESAVREATSLSASQAVEKHVIDLIAKDTPDLLAQLDGRQVTTASGVLTLQTRQLSVERVSADWRTQLLAVLTNPNVAYLLLLVGIYGLLLEGYNPGAVLPGITGAICLVLALYALQILSVNYAGLALILLGVALFIAEGFIGSFGALGVGGIVAFVTGSILLLDRTVPGFAIARPLIAAMGFAGGLIAVGIVAYAVRARARPVVTGVEQLLGETAVAVSDFAQAGTVRVRGELWQAVTQEEVRSGDTLRILRVDGLTVTVGRPRAGAATQGH
ncbi:MAG: nodulation protein NfeD [Steroidobacterales bacterium]